MSYEYIAKRLPRVAPDIAGGRVIVAHLGSGASMCAMKGGKSVESTMGFTALDGLAMGTRPGQLDPGVVLYLLTEKGMSASNVQNFLYCDCGLKGLSGVSNDMRELEASADPRAAFAIDYFVYPRGMFGEIPQFALGRWYWDQWLVYRARRLGGALIDDPATLCFVCGPETMVADVPRMLNELGIDRTRVRVEEW